MESAGDSADEAKSRMGLRAIGGCGPFFIGRDKTGTCSAVFCWQLCVEEITVDGAELVIWARPLAERLGGILVTK